MLQQVSFHHHQPNYLIVTTIEKPKTCALKHMSIPVSHFTSPTRKNLNNIMIFTCKNIQTSARSHASTASPIVNVQRNFWIDYFLNYTPDNLAMQAERVKQVNELKEEVRKELLENIAHKPMRELLKYLDSIRRLGLGYHFEDEIEAALNQLYHHDIGKYCYDNDHHDLDLHDAALMFRLLRQHGYYIPCDIFKQFLDDNGKFKESLSSDVEAMLSLYEASYLIAYGDDILNQALTFTTTQLKLIKGRLNDHQLAMKVAHALEYPIHKTVARLGSRYYISQYEHNPFHSKILLKFAKLDFNLLQALHKKELGELTRWCHDWGVPTRLPYNVRELLVEIYFCALGALNECPQHSFGRKIYFKLLWVGTIFDDLYDILDIADLTLLTQAIQRWDKGCVNQLPNNLKYIYTVLLDVFDEVQHQLAKEGRSHNFHYMMESFNDLWTIHLQLSKWCHEEYVPSFEAYMSGGKQAVGGKACTILSYICLGEIATQQVFEWAIQFPKVIQAFGKIARIKDDIAEDDPMEEVATNKPSAVSCYMKQHKGINKDQAYEELQKILNDAWKDINQAMLRPTIMPRPVLERILTQSRFSYVFSRQGDGFDCSDKTPMKMHFKLLFKDPIPM